MTKGLTIESGTLISEETDNRVRDIQSKLSTMHGVALALEEKGLPVHPVQPRITYPDIGLSGLPENPSPGDYTSAWEKNLHWLSYLHRLMSDAQNVQVAAENDLKLTQKALWRGYLEENRKMVGTAGKRSEAEIEALVMTHPSYVLALVTSQQNEQMRKKLETFIAEISRNLQVLSRHVTLRGQELERSFHQGTQRRGKQTPFMDPIG